MALLVRISALFCLVVLGGSGLYAQTKADTSFIRIKWLPSRTLVVDGKEQRVVSFLGAIHLKINNNLPLYSQAFDGKHLENVSLADAVWEEFVGATGLDLSIVPNEASVNVTNDWSSRDAHSSISFYPIRKNPLSGKVELLVKFKLKWTEKQAIYPQKGLSNRFQNRLSAGGSVLAQGQWYKLAFPSSGIYKIDYSYLMQMGINPDSVNVNNLQIWGNGGMMLPEACSAPRPVDLKETPILIVGLGDGKFDFQDYMLLYVQGPNGWTFNASTGYFEPRNHLYSSYAYYFLTIGSSPGKRIQEKSPSSVSPEKEFTSYSCRYVHEKENVNFLSSGRMWFGEDFSDNLSQTFPVPSTGIVAGTKITLVSSLLNKSTSDDPGYFYASLNGRTLNTYSIAGSSMGDHYPIGVVKTFTESVASDAWANSNSLNVNYVYERASDGLGTGYLDYFALNFEENLSFKSNPMDFRQVGSSAFGAVSYSITTPNGIEGLKVWDVTDLGAIQQESLIATTDAYSLVTETNGIVKEYVAFYGSSFPSPSSFTSITNQNIAATSTPDLLIVTHPLFKASAEKLAEFRRTFDKLDVVVATTEEVFNEFSSGAQDLVAIRDCAKMYFDRADGAKFKYLLMFGDASFDYRNLLNYPSPTSYVPIFESQESLQSIDSYSSDDFVGIMSDENGTWGDGVFFPMDIGVGRIPAKTEVEADNVVEKLIHYASGTKTLGAWRNNITYVADNADKLGEGVFLTYAESVASAVEASTDQFNIKKVYVGAYPKEFIASGTTASGANVDIMTALNEQGTLLMNYIGHGGIDQWASENIMNMSMLRSLSNIDKLSFLVTATCNYGQYDIPSYVSGGEEFLLHPKGGAVGLLTTTRAVYQGTNEYLNNAFHKHVFSKNPDGSHLRVGDIMRKTKSDSRDGREYVRNFALLGDPSSMLAYAKDTIVITKINELPYVSGSDTLKARSKVTISGEIRDFTGQRSESFNGVVSIILFDKKTSSQTFNEPGSASLPFQVLNTKIFDGSATVKDGQFTFTLIIPRNINYNVGLGKFSLYANREDGTMGDASCGEAVYVGSSDTNSVVDNTPPVIKIFMNDESFVPGGYTNNNPVLLVKLYDEQGISGVGGVGKSIMGNLLHSNTQSDIILDSYYKTDRDTYKSGTIRYQLSNLSEGSNTIKVKAFDTDTNSATSSLDFIVAANKTLSLQHVLNYPNPFTTNTSFHFDHNRPGDNLDVMIQVFTVSGKLVKTMFASSINAHTHFSDIVWDGKDDYGDEIGRGVYVYKVSVKAMSDGSKIEQFEKLVILN